MKKIFILLFLLSFFVLSGCNNVNDEETNGLDEEYSSADIAEFYNNAAVFMKGISNQSKTVALSYVESDSYDTLNSVIALIKLASLIYSNENFVVSNEFVSFNLVLGNNEIRMNWLTEINPENNKLVATLIYYDINDSENSTLFMYFDINYDFENDSVLGFEVRQHIMNLGSNLHFKYENEKFYLFDPFADGADESSGAEIKNETTSLFETYYAKMTENVIVLDVDYTTEYNLAMEYAFS